MKSEGESKKRLERRGEVQTELADPAALFYSYLKKLRNKAEKAGVDINYPLLEYAFQFAKKAHRKQTRKSGEPYIYHPIEVFGILVEKEVLDTDTLAAALLHDVVEDTECSLIDIRAHFGGTISYLVNGVTKFPKNVFPSRTTYKEENLKRLYLSTLKDVRVLFIKFADRLHNLRCLGAIKDEEKRKEKAYEALFFFAPLAGRLGLYSFKIDLENEGFKWYMPEEYNRITAKLKQKEKTLKKILNKAIATIKHEISEHMVYLRVKYQGRIKRPFSIYRKMMEYKISFEDVTDLIGVRVIVPTVYDCYTVLGIIHNIEGWEYVQGRLRDYISAPKPNGYSSLHTMVKIPVSKNKRMNLEVQIRTYEMHMRAEYGLAAHWLYTEQQMKQMLKEIYPSITRNFEIPATNLPTHVFLRVIEKEFAAESIFVYTPQKEKIFLPKNSTVLDFAFYLSSEVGLKFKRGFVNDREVPPNYVLGMGDEVRVETDDSVQPTAEWLEMVNTERARYWINKALKKEEEEDAKKLGKLLLQRAIWTRRHHHYNLLEGELLERCASYFSLNSKEELLEAVGKYKLTAMEVEEVLYKLHKEKLKSVSPMKGEEIDIRSLKRSYPVSILNISSPSGEELDDREVEFPNCCYPLPGDQLVLLDNGEKYVLHRKECFETQGKGGKQVNLSTTPGLLFLSRVHVQMLNEPGVVRTIDEIITKHKVNLVGGMFAPYKQKESMGFFHIIMEVKNRHQLQTILSEISKVEGVVSVSRYLKELEKI